MKTPLAKKPEAYRNVLSTRAPDLMVDYTKSNPLASKFRGKARRYGPAWARSLAERLPGDRLRDRTWPPASRQRSRPNVDSQSAPWDGPKLSTILGGYVMQEVNADDVRASRSSADHIRPNKNTARIGKSARHLTVGTIFAPARTMPRLRNK